MLPLLISQIFTEQLGYGASVVFDASRVERSYRETKSLRHQVEEKEKVKIKCDLILKGRKYGEKERTHRKQLRACIG